MAERTDGPKVAEALSPLSLSLSINLSVCLSACLPVCLSPAFRLVACLAGWLAVCACLSVYLFVCLPGWLAVCLSICLSGCLSVSLSLCLSVHLSFYPTICLSDYLLSTYLPTYLEAIMRDSARLCETSFKTSFTNGKSGVQSWRPRQCQCVLRFFSHSMCLKRCACHKKK